MTALSLQHPTQNWIAPSFSSIKTISEVGSVGAGLMIFSASILLILAFSSSLFFVSARDGAQFTGVVSGCRSSLRCFAKLMRPR